MRSTIELLLDLVRQSQQLLRIELSLFGRSSASAGA